MKIRRSFARCVLVILATSATFSTSVRAVDLDPVQLGSWPGEPGRSITDVEVQGDYAYCTLSDYGLVVLDIGNAETPRKVGAFPTSGFSGNTGRIVVSGSQAYLFHPITDPSGCGADGRIVVLDISNPTLPRLLGEPFGLCFEMGDLWFPRNIAISGSNLLLAGRGLEILDISDPTALKRAGGYRTQPGDGEISGLAVSGTRAFLGENRWDAAVTNRWGGLTILDVSNPATPRRIGRLEADAPGELVLDVKVYGQDMLVVLSDTLEVQIIDVSDAANPRCAAQFDLPESSGVIDIALAGNLAYLVGGRGLLGPVLSGLEILEITDLASPRRIGRFARGSLFHRVLLTGDKALVVDTGPESMEATGIRLINVNVPANPQRIGRYLPPRGLPRHAASSGHIVTVATGGVIDLLDNSDPISPLKLGEYNLQNDIYSLAMAGGYIFVVGGTWDSAAWPASVWWGAVKIVDINDPANPRRVGGIDLPPSLNPVDLAVAGTTVYASQWEMDGNGVTHLQISLFDVAVPTTPILLGTVAMSNSGVFDGLSIYRGLVVAVFRGGGGLLVIDIAEPTKPKVIGSIDVAGIQGKPSVLGRYAYVATYGGLVVVDLIDPTSPRVVGRNLAVGRSGPGGMELNVAAGDRSILAWYGDELVFLEPFVTPLGLRMATRPDTAEVRLSLDGPVGRIVRVQRSKNLRDWDEWKTVLLDTGPMELTDSAAEQQGFYRPISHE